MGRPKDYYAILGVAIGATLDEIKSAYRRLARQFHPDIQDTSNIERFRDVQEAYEVLSDRDKRRAYDLSAGAEIPISFGPGVEPFEEVWPGSTPSRTRSHRKRSRVLEKNAEIVISPEEARQGGILSFEAKVVEACPACEGTGQGFINWCWDCDGSGELLRYQRVRFSIPPGVEHGDTLTAALGPGQGKIKARVLISQVR